MGGKKKKGGKKKSSGGDDAVRTYAIATHHLITFCGLHANDRLLTFPFSRLSSLSPSLLPCHIATLIWRLFGLITIPHSKLISIGQRTRC